MYALGIIAAMMAAVAYGMSTVLRALGARRVAVAEREETGLDQPESTDDGAAPSMSSTVATLGDPAFILGTVMVVIGFAGGAVAARFLPLFLAQSIVSANLIVTALVGTFILNITLHTRDWVAIWLVVLSLALLGISSAPSANDHASTTFHWGLLGAAFVIGAIGLVGVYTLGAYAAFVGGFCGGLQFGVIAIAVRVLEGVAPFDPVRVLTDPAAWAIAVAGASGFFVQTVALQVGAVNGVTAVLVVGETAAPSVIGVAFLGDHAQAGLGWLAWTGFIGAVIGAILVAWYGSGDPDHFGEAPEELGGWRRGRADEPSSPD
ncbi:MULTISPECIES: EamA/RhaT family transporter [unclassified Gordonia (in: high G+C Gram-positive bacteria)]|uniref:EamA/RhaT family transporter n=1 Tax=unclassified Gordonia (in: high G+C Gram-positive bacteria) TaxID=2657482 RepID=UPI001FFEC75F|nr:MULTISPECIES: EamA/RhaT family transporter [unclassified Gordonia (in: high G+C Gram-positive bacteria)]UQE75408.1 EamA/RhaT family transporter [Gordonia sp. PP30]